MSNRTKLENLGIFKMGTPNNPTNRLARSIGADATTLYFEDVVNDDDVILGIRTAEYTELVYLPEGSLAVDGKSATGVIRGLNPTASDYTTSDSDYACVHPQGALVSNVVSPQMMIMLNQALRGEIANGGNKFIVGREQGEHIYYAVKTDTGVIDILRRNNTTSKIEWTDNNGTTWTAFADAGGHGTTADIANHTQVDDSANTPTDNTLLAGITSSGKWEKKDYKLALPSVSTPSATPSNDQDKIVLLNSSGKIDAGFISADSNLIKIMQTAEAINGSSTPQCVTLNATITEEIKQQNDNSDNIESIKGNSFCAQSFQHTSAFYMTKASVYLKCTTALSSGNINVDVYLAGTDHRPTGSSLGTASISDTTITTTWAYHDFTFSSAIFLDADTEYVLIFSWPDGSDWILEIGTDRSNLYPNGISMCTGDGGSNWTLTATQDYRFKVHGKKIDFASTVIRADADSEIGIVGKMPIIGFTTDNVASGVNATVKLAGLMSGFSGLTAGKTYYVSDTVGAIATSPGTTERKVGVATSATEILIS